MNRFIMACATCLAAWACVSNVLHAFHLKSLASVSTFHPPSVKADKTKGSSIVNTTADLQQQVTETRRTSTDNKCSVTATVIKRHYQEFEFQFNASLLARLPNCTNLPLEVYHGPLTQRNQREDLHKTKIVGFITSKYSKIARRWYDRLKNLGYTNHYIICTDDATYRNFRTNYAHYRVEASYLPPWPTDLDPMNSTDDMRQLRMLFAHRWVYLLEQLKLGNHILLTDVDNIFSSYYSMTELERSEYDVYHALETRHPEDVWNYQGFVFCGGMGWFRSSPRTIRFIDEMVLQCGSECDDQELLNMIIAYELKVSWNRTGDDRTPETNETNARVPRLGYHFKRLAGLVTKGFTGYSVATGVKIKVWDRDFAYRGKNDPLICPQQNWVSMPFVIFYDRSHAPRRKFKSYDLWDKTCPNMYTNLTARGVKKTYNRG
jgi:Nucleotide-diphospho-sugar transferase